MICMFWRETPCGINPEYSLEGPNLRLQSFGYLMWSWLIGKDPDAGKDWVQEEKQAAENDTVGWHHPLNRHEFEQTPRDSEVQGGLMCCSPWGHKESDMTQQLTTKTWILLNINCFTIQLVFNIQLHSVKRQKDMTLKDELPWLVGAQYATVEEWRNKSRGNEKAKPKGKQLWVCMVVEGKSNAVKSNIA